VVYGLVGHKTHCKLCLVVRSEGRAMKNYAHLGTGNYNPRTAKLYTDLSYFTSRKDITSDVAQLFNTLTGFGRTQRFRNIVVAPFNLHRRIGELIDREAANARNGKPARILAKMNALVDKATIDALYAASQAGVKIELIVRGVCCLVPGVKGLSENISVRSIVGRFLEHARCFYFENAGGEPLILAGSADWMPRNFFRRVEVLFPIRDAALRHWITSEFFPVEQRDNDNAHVLDSSGAYRPAHRGVDERPFSAQAYFMADAMKRSEVKE
jgi:polyphosphate kinase